jgi:hypothetical protein
MEKNEIDYKKLLMKYMEHVYAVSGDTFAYALRVLEEDHRKLPIFTRREVSELVMVENIVLKLS